MSDARVNIRNSTETLVVAAAKKFQLAVRCKSLG